MTDATTTPVVRPLELLDTEIRFYEEEGYLYLPQFVASDAVAALREEVFEVLEANGLSRASLCQASTEADKLRQFTQYLAGSQLDRLINGSEATHVASQLIGGPAHPYMPFTAVKAGGGGGTFDYHQDNNYTRHEPALGSLNIWVALNDMTPANGCLRVLPRSHREGQLPSTPVGDGHRKLAIDESRLLPVRMRAGDAIAFTRWTVHGSGPNDTDQPRVAYALQFHRSDVKWLDPATDEWKLLVDHPRFAVAPVTKLGPKT